MDTYEVLSLLFSRGVFLLALLTYIDRNQKENKNAYLCTLAS